MSLSPLLSPVSFDVLPGWQADDPAPALAAFARSAARARDKPYRSGSLGIVAPAFAAAFAAAAATPAGRDAARAFFEAHFVPCRIGAAGSGFVTGFYEPELAASPVRTARFTVPLLARPHDLVELDDVASRPACLAPDLVCGRRLADGRIVAHPDRRAIESGALADRGLALAWLADRVDAFFVHVQGAVRLTMPDGTVRRLTYAGKSGHPFTGPGRVLAGLGAIPPEHVTMQTIRAWLAAHPERIDEILWQNRSYIFFRDSETGDPGNGPVAAAKVQLAPGRSLAVDRLLHSFATPVFVDAPALTAVDGRPFRRLMVAQDTGSAIVGPARGDIFTGTGAAAGEIAGVIRHAATFHALVPRPLVEARA
ncbi:MltA domain-containing protein [Aquibium sp. A9E412]|uniref:murein transglycosylase A n=1 Tax=Aquibium sp. A9E412 TaxID=2976767 RepID=UPI0025B00382|nr:MltA domain-containing protein [Aquibium sp. A9E412]MDN2568606.1 MltA domain-containing protein [Aquibium sp. A9E412]